ncbi:hypothetical protein HMPREF1978_01874 [Actinomyces graevenitzii F0530]|uniref:Uncharacterized protein n=1 Tax=Actinomyces graevenitzii F0530 TaxID=1321817 RepID=U1R6U6_9ACTO|nr:hypothetical protein HMPREF1978_01874 [Actinomyces graevenitzii F0530]
MSRFLNAFENCLVCFPRSRGDEPASAPLCKPHGKFSPLTRG